MKIEKIKKIFKVKTTFQFFIVMLVFSITGSLALFLSDYLLFIFNLDIQTSGNFSYWLLRVVVLFPVYQILLITVGTLFGEFEYFWRFEKKFLKKLGFKLK